MTQLLFSRNCVYIYNSGLMDRATDHMLMWFPWAPHKDIMEPSTEYRFIITRIQHLLKHYKRIPAAELQLLAKPLNDITAVERQDLYQIYPKLARRLREIQVREITI